MLPTTKETPTHSERIPTSLSTSRSFALNTTRSFDGVNRLNNQQEKQIKECERVMKREKQGVKEVFHEIAPRFSSAQKSWMSYHECVFSNHQKLEKKGKTPHYLEFRRMNPCNGSHAARSKTFEGMKNGSEGLEGELVAETELLSSNTIG